MDQVEKTKIERKLKIFIKMGFTKNFKEIVKCLLMNPIMISEDNNVL